MPPLTRACTRSRKASQPVHEASNSSSQPQFMSFVQPLKASSGAAPLQCGSQIYAQRCACVGWGGKACHAVTCATQATASASDAGSECWMPAVSAEPPAIVMPVVHQR